MTKKQASKLKVGDYVTWREEMQFTTPQAIAASTGDVIETGYSAFKVRWGDGLVAQYKNEFAAHIHRLV